MHTVYWANLLPTSNVRKPVRCFLLSWNAADVTGQLHASPLFLHALSQFSIFRQTAQVTFQYGHTQSFHTYRSSILIHTDTSDIFNIVFSFIRIRLPFNKPPSLLSFLTTATQLRLPLATDGVIFHHMELVRLETPLRRHLYKMLYRKTYVMNCYMLCAILLRNILYTPNDVRRYLMRTKHCAHASNTIQSPPAPAGLSSLQRLRYLLLA
jgi:hypothetical protein